MDKLKTAKEIGLRCRRFRNALGLSQDALGEKVGILGATISKYEREGIYDIEKIQELSQALGHDLLMDEVDQEGTVGEIGKEILQILLVNGGFVSVKFLMSKMHGMSKERVSNEIFKLERIGMCVREQYIDWDELDADDLFITAKGIITFKNMNLNKLTEDIAENFAYDACSYEEIIGEFDSYQAYIDNHPAEKLIRNIVYSNYAAFYNDEKEKGKLSTPTIFLDWPYRINYVKYLKTKFEGPVYKDSDMGIENDMDLISGQNVYIDILYRMSMNITDDMLWHTLYVDKKIDTSYLEFIMPVLASKLDYKYKYDDETVRRAAEWFESKFNDGNRLDEANRLVDYLNIIKNFSQVAFDDISKEYYGMTREKVENMPEEFFDDIEKRDEYENSIKDTMEAITDAVEELQDRINEMSVCINPRNLFENNRPEGASIYPMDWFTEEEIRDFINNKIGSKEEPEDEELDAVLKKINEMMPETLDYYTFPEEWEHNGLADLVREKYGIEKPQPDDDDEDDELEDK